MNIGTIILGFLVTLVAFPAIVLFSDMAWFSALVVSYGLGATVSVLLAVRSLIITAPPPPMHFRPGRQLPISARRAGHSL